MFVPPAGLFRFNGTVKIYHKRLWFLSQYCGGRIKGQAMMFALVLLHAVMSGGTMTRVLYQGKL